MKHWLYYIISLLIVTNCFAQNSSVQLPGGVQFRDFDEDKPYIVKANENVESIIRNNIFVRVNVAKTSCFVGEPLLVTYKLYTRLHSQSKVVKQPEFSGCSVVEMTTDDLAAERELIGGKWFRSYVIRKVQLFPLQEGDIILGTAAVENNVSLFANVTEAYNNRPGISKTVTLSSDVLPIHIQALPEENKPVTFNGVVGKFTISTAVSKANDTANDNNTLQITIEGKGNFQSLGCPMINWPGGIEHFEPESDESFDRLSFPVTGKKIFTIPFTCKKEGKITIPQIAFSYFNNQTKVYNTAFSDSIPLNILPEVKQVDAIKLSGDITNKKYIFIVPGIALLAGCGWWFFFGKKEQPKVVVPVEAEEDLPVVIIKSDTEKLNELLLIEEDKAYYEYAKSIALHMAQHTPNVGDKKELLQLVSECNEALYAPNSVLTKESVLQRLEKFIYT